MHLANDLLYGVSKTQGRGLRATVVYFDPNHDLAVLHVPNLGEPTLAVTRIRVGQAGAVYGHPGGGPLTPAPAKVVQQFVCDPDGNHIEISQRASLTGGNL